MTLSAARILGALSLWSSTTALATTTYPASSTMAEAREAHQRGLTVRGLYQQVEARLARSGKIYKAVITRTQQGGGYHRTDVRHVWVDARHNLAREQTTERFTFGTHRQTYTFTAVYAGGTTYARGPVAPGQPAVQTSPVFTCNGAHVAAAVILGCPNPVQKWTMSLQSGQYAGRQVLILLRKGSDSSENSSGNSTTRIYLDRQTLLPLAETTSGTLNSKPMQGRASYVSTLVSPSSVPASFFQPSSLGYRGRADQIKQEMKSVPPGFTVLWLGLDFARRQGLPALSIQRAVPGEGGKDTFSIELYYMPTHHLFGRPLLYMEEWSSTAARRQAQPPTGAGWTKRTVTLENGHAVILTGRATMAFAYIGSTIALIQPTGSVLSSARAMEALVRVLRPYVPSA